MSRIETNQRLGQKNSFVMYHDWYRSFKRLGEERAGKLLFALFELEINGEDITEQQGFDEAMLMAWDQMSTILEVNREKYAERCEINSEIAKHRWEKEKAKSRTDQLRERLYGDNEQD